MQALSSSHYPTSGRIENLSRPASPKPLDKDLLDRFYEGLSAEDRAALDELSTQACGTSFVLQSVEQSSKFFSSFTPKHLIEAIQAKNHKAGTGERETLMAPATPIRSGYTPESSLPAENTGTAQGNLKAAPGASPVQPAFLIPPGTRAKKWWQFWR
ncbi:MAG: hypothetical protein H7Y17_17170 [Chlorobia bacterium]|nr:hypothetical protein [Fimbriimonadaceae bacterium]